jgi:hypothetical protein
MINDGRMLYECNFLYPTATIFDLNHQLCTLYLYYDKGNRFGFDVGRQQFANGANDKQQASVY